MTYFSAALIVVLCAGAAGVASFLVGRRIPLETRRRHHDVGAPVFAQVGVMVSVLLAFVFSEVWGEYNIAAQSVNGECAALHGAAVLANALPNGEGQGVDRAIVNYAGIVVRQEWPLMARRHRSPVAAAAIEATLAQAVRIKPLGPSEVAVQERIVGLVSTAHAFRETRTFQLNFGLPAAVWAVLVIISLMLVLFVVMAGAENPAHIIFASAFAGSIALVLVVVRMLDFPFEGALAIGPGDFVKVLGEASALLR